MIRKYYAHSPDNPDKLNPKELDWQLAHYLVDHLLSVAKRARKFGASFGAGDWSHLAGLWHDLGKYRQSFQDFIQGKPHDEKGHQWAGAAHALDKLGTLGHPIAMAIAGHHGGLPARNGDQRSFSARKEKARYELEEALVAEVPDEILAGSDSGLREAFGKLAKRVGNDDPEVIGELFTRMLFSTLVDADYLDTAEFYLPENAVTRAAAQEEQKTPSQLASVLRDHMQGLAEEAEVNITAEQDESIGARRSRVLANRLQVLAECQERADAPTGFFSLTVPTGGGKTLASMSFALEHAAHHGLERVIVVVPFTTIIEQNAAVYENVFGAVNVIEHHSSWDPKLNSLEESRCSHRHKLLCENWDAPIVVTTSVQFLESLHANKTSACRKLHRLARSVIIFDEIQTLPVHLLDVTLASLRVLIRGFGSSLVCCTATQPAFKSGYRLNKIQPGLGKVQPIVAEPGDLFASMTRVQVTWPEDPHAPKGDWPELALSFARHDQVLVIVHKRRDAWDLAQLLGEDWLHLSASMLPYHRSGVVADIKQCLKKGLPCRVVSTQVVEAGVDIDFPVVYRAMAGFESLAQSAGRCNREGKLALGRFIIFKAPTSPPRGVLENGLAIARAMRAEAEVNLQNPELYPIYFQKLYAIAPQKIEIFKHRKERNFPEIARSYRLIENADMTSVVIPWEGFKPDKKTLLEAIERFRDNSPRPGDMRLLTRASVTLPERQVLAWAQAGLVTYPKHFPIPILNMEDWSERYDDRLGLDLFSSPTLDVNNLIL